MIYKNKKRLVFGKKAVFGYGTEVCTVPTQLIEMLTELQILATVRQIYCSQDKLLKYLTNSQRWLHKATVLEKKKVFFPRTVASRSQG